MRSDARRFAGWVAGAMWLVAGRARADVVVNETIAGHPVRVERNADGSLTLRLEGHDPVALGAGTAPQVQHVAIGTGAALVVRFGGEHPSAIVVAGSATVPPDVLFAGSTSWRGDDPGERHRSDVVVRDLDNDGHDDVVIGERREDVQLCGFGSPLVDAQAIDARSMRLAHVTLNPLRPDLLAEGTTAPHLVPLHAVAVPTPVVPSVRSVNVHTRVGHGATLAGAAVLTDRSDATTWTVSRHDFATAGVSLAGFPAERIVLVAPPEPAHLPSHFVVLTGAESPALDVTLPPGVGMQPGSRIAVPIVPARAIQCLSLVVIETPAHGPGAIADLDVVSALDHEPNAAAALVDRLAGPQADVAALLLGSMGDAGIDAVATALPTLPLVAARTAVRLLANQRTARAAVGLVGAMARPDLEQSARAALLHMGPVALEPLAAVVVTVPRAADLIQNVQAPLEDRLRAMAATLPAERSAWHVARGAVRGLVEEASRTGHLVAWLALVPADPGAAARALSVAAEAAQDDAQRALIAQRARAVSATRFEDRFRLLVPLAGDAEGRTAVVQIALHDDNADLRWEAVHALAGRGADDVLAQALADRVPRVRAEAARGLARVTTQRDALVASLTHDTWPSVRGEAAAALAGDAANAATLLTALDDSSLVVVRAAIAALEHTPGAFAPRLMTFAEDERRNPDLRADALHVVASRCDRAVTPRLEALARHQIDPMLPPPEQAIGHAALAAIAHIDPARARAFLHGMEANAFAVAAVERATHDACPAH